MSSEACTAIIVFIAFLVFAGGLPGPVRFKKIMDCYIQKKRGSLYLLHVPHFEAFALPSLIERATQKPTLCMYTPIKAQCKLAYAMKAV